MERKLTRFLTLLISLLVLVSLCVTAVSAEELKVSDDPKCYLHGDVNGDGKVGTQDAIYALYYAMWHDVDETLYPMVNQEFDFTGDGKVSTKDALYLLWASYEQDGYELEGDIHEYYKPYWTWDVTGEAPAATLNVRCGCGEPIALGAEQGVTVTSVITEATCVAPGKAEYTAKITYEGVEYTSEPYAVEIPTTAEGHQMSGEQGCETKSECDLCDYELPALGHSWKLNAEKSVAATCTTMGKQWYDCACGDHYEVQVETVPHTHAFFASGDPVLKEGTTCTYVTTNTYRCACGDEVTQDSQYDKHTYKAVVTLEATCNAAGVKTYVCEYCGHENGRTEQIPVNADAHNWGEGVLYEATGITTHTCSVCGGTKTAVTVSRNQEIPNEQLTNELQLENANVSLDEQTVAGLDAEKTVQISVEPANKESVSLTEEQKEQVGTNTIYDFKMAYNDGQPVTNFDGYVTVSLPYTLAEGEDIDAIDVWFISDEGELEQVFGTYANGYVTFKTNHFSYYTVTRLTPAQRCDRYGHIWIAAEKAATCTEDGYSKDVCQRCGSEANAVAIPALEHNYVDASDAAAATCDEAGLKHQTCQRCSHEIKEELPALGHELVADQANSQEADCYNPGKTVKYCTLCDYTSVEETAQLNHDFGENQEETEYPSCNSSGKKHKKCVLCGQKIKLEEIVPLGHDYGVVAWHWNEDRTSATVDLQCKNDPGHTQTRKAAITIDKDKSSAVSCTSNGYVVYVATATFNKVTFTDTVYVETEALGHQTSGEWQSTGTGHHRICSVCGEKADVSGHVWDEVVTKEATCAAAGTREDTCIVCGYATTVSIPATGKHEMLAGECTVCGFSQETCAHVKLTHQKMDLSGYDVCEGTEIYVASCECGENQYLALSTSGCTWGGTTVYEKTLDDGTQITVNSMTCSACGLTYESCYNVWYLDEEICRTYNGQYGRLLVDGQIIQECTYVNRSGGMYQDHPPYILKETVDVSTLGMCGGTLTVTECRCGLVKNSYFGNDACSWIYSDDTQTCSVCGTTRTYDESDEFEKSGCAILRTQVITYSRDGQTLYTIDGAVVYSTHDYKVVKYVLDGLSCYDGVTVYSVCEDCGHEYTSYYTWHISVTEEVTDLTGYGSCATAVYRSVCACGQSRSGGEYFDDMNLPAGMMGHEFALVSEDPETRTYVYVCAECNYTRTATNTQEKLEGTCKRANRGTYTFTDGEGHTYSFEEYYEYESHDYVSETVLLGTSCTDGVETRMTCADCGDSYLQQTNYGHIAVETQVYDLTVYDVCGGTLKVYECPCKTFNTTMYIPGCNWQWVSGDVDSSLYSCYLCGATKEEIREVLVQMDVCHQKLKYTQIYSQKDEELLRVSYTSEEPSHKEVYSFKLNDPDAGCDGGYVLTCTCLNCDLVDSWENSGHIGYAVEREVVSVNQLCGDLELVTYSCACGEDIWVNYEWSNGFCDFQWRDGKDVCTKCGAVRTDGWTYKTMEGESCKVVSTYSIVIVRNGKTVCDFSYDLITTNHKEQYNYTLLGETCDDGYTYTVTCSGCGMLMYEETNVRYGCSTQVVEDITVASHEDICGDVRIRLASCACGRKKSVWTSYNCNTQYVGWDEDTNSHMYQCVNCGLVHYEHGVYEPIKGTCTANEEIYRRCELNGEVLGTYEGSYVVEFHETVASFDLWGETCDDGYEVFYTCVNCGMLTSQYSTYGHDQHFQIGYVDLSDYGMCGGEAWRSGCPCGLYGGNWNMNYECLWEHQGYDEATGTTTWFCAACGTYRHYTEVGQRDPATCTYTGTWTYSFVRNGVELLNLSSDLNYEEHETVVDSATLLNPEGNCYDGVVITNRCVDCGYSYSNTYYYHVGYTVQEIDLSDGCGGSIRLTDCACGEGKGWSYEYECRNMTRVNWSEQDENNIVHTFYQETCSDCGLTIGQEWYNVYPEDSCVVTQYQTYTVTYGGETYTHDSISSWDSHQNLVYTGAVLEADSVTCLDGVWVQWICKDCGETGEYGYNYHQAIPKESIDLGAYGSDCGATLVRYECACGQQQRYDIGGDSECDVHNNSIANWVPGSIHDTQDTTDGYIGTYSNSYLVKCAVTDPVACGMTIRMSEYWLNEDCMAVEYQTWQLGYDEATGTYDREITIKTGEQHAYHPYEQTQIQETLDDGSRVTGTQWTCPDCGSYAYQKDTVDANGVPTKFECRYVNTLYAVNGEHQERGDTTEYGYIANGNNYTSSYYSYWIHNDGYLEWNLHEYSNYDFSNNDCRRTVTWTTDRNDISVSEESAHLIGDCEYYYDPEPTCSQHGTQHHIHECVVCGKEDTHDMWEVYPTGHGWYWDNSKQTYVCSYCELENAVGTTGSIYMEDLTDDANWGSQTDYVVGYWNSDNIEVIPQVSIILDDWTDDNQYVLTGITFDYLTVKEDGVRALTFSKAEAQAAAETAIANISYTGSYAIRISFVPTTGDNTLDYAITFDSQNTVQ